MDSHLISILYNIFVCFLSVNLCKYYIFTVIIFDDDEDDE